MRRHQGRQPNVGADEQPAGHSGRDGLGDDPWPGRAKGGGHAGRLSRRRFGCLAGVKPLLGKPRYHGAVMPERLFTGPSEFVIWTVSALLALVAGVGTAFFLWSLLRHTGEPVVAQAAIVSFGIGLALVGISTEKALVRVFLLPVCCHAG